MEGVRKVGKGLHQKLKANPIASVNIGLELDKCAHDIDIALSCGKMERTAKPVTQEKTLEKVGKRRRGSDRRLAGEAIEGSEVVKTRRR
jgi:hypothetical protein